MDQKGQVTIIGMADLNICIPPNGISTLGLGSCVGVAIRDPISKVGGLAHIMLPDSTAVTGGPVNIPKYADTGIEGRGEIEVGCQNCRWSTDVCL